MQLQQLLEAVTFDCPHIQLLLLPLLHALVCTASVSRHWHQFFLVRHCFHCCLHLYVQHHLEDTCSKVKVCIQDAVVMAQKLHALIHPSSDGASPRSLRSVATADLIHVLRDYEKERKSRTRLITVRSNLMGQALQIPFDPVCSLNASAHTPISIFAMKNCTASVIAHVTHVTSSSQTQHLCICAAQLPCRKPHSSHSQTCCYALSGICALLRWRCTCSVVFANCFDVTHQLSMLPFSL